MDFICAWWKLLQTGKAAWKPAQHNHKFGNKLPLPDAFAVPFAFYGFEALQFSSSFFKNFLEFFFILEILSK